MCRFAKYNLHPLYRLKTPNIEEPKAPVRSDDQNEEVRETLITEENEQRGNVKTDSSPQVSTGNKKKKPWSKVSKSFKKSGKNKN